MRADVSQIPLALYIHIPWCERKCPYCDFNSHENFDPAFEAPYIDALLADLASQRHWGNGRSLCSIFIGGGTPSLFSAHSIAALLDGIDHLYGLGDNVEITLESNPGSAEAERYHGYRMAGVNRLSIGVQSFNKHQLTALGRVHNAAQARLACDLAARHFDRFNIDLMHGPTRSNPSNWHSLTSMRVLTVVVGIFLGINSLSNPTPYFGHDHPTFP